MADYCAIPQRSVLRDSVTFPLEAFVRGMSRIVSVALVALIGIYRLTISPLLGPSCRFSPSCSAYAIEAIRCHGPLRGVRAALLRLARCSPLCDGGYDPVR